MLVRNEALLVAIFAAGCAATATKNAAAPSRTTIQSIALPGANGPVVLDYIAYDRANKRVWVPAGNTGRVDVIDMETSKVTPIEGFATQEMERNGKKRTVGPSSATVGEGVVYVGNRGDFTVCAFDARTLKKGACVKIESMPDGLAYVASVKEVWVTTPRDKSLQVLDASAPDALTVKTKMTFDGEPEGFAVDDARGVFYTNLEDKDRTLAIDIKSHQITKTWMPSCGEDGPKGLAHDHALNYLFVACADKVKVLDANHDGSILSTIETGDGVDNIDYVEARKQLFVGAAKAAKLTVATIDLQGKLMPQAVVATATGARNAAATEEGAAYLTCAPEGKILVVPPTAQH
jgi:DNA-binding beta-propeller fold protein YncE